MTWLSTENAHDIRSFAEAEYLFNEIKPINSKNYRTKDVDGVPIMKHRRDWDHKSLHKINNDTYAMRLYSTDVVQVHRDNSITIDVSYGSNTTNAWAEHWIHQLTGRYMGVWSDRNCLGMSWMVVSDEQHKQYKLNVPLSKQDNYAYFFTDTDKFRLEWLGNDKWYVHEAAPRFVKRVDKSAAYHKRKVLQPMIDYLKIYESMPMEEDTYRALQKEFSEEHGWRQNPCELAVANPDDTSMWAYVAALFHNAEWSYDWQTQRHSSESRLATMPTIKKNLYKFLYDKEGINDFQQLAIGESRHAELYTTKQVENHNG